MRREVLDRVGPLDEGYATGFFEDDDLCVAARKAAAAWAAKIRERYGR